MNSNNNVTHSKYLVNELINVSSQNLHLLPDLSQFIQVKYLYCHHNNIYILPTFPPSFHTLISLDCSYNDLKFLPKLPVGLRNLDCSHNHLERLPKLPVGLHDLNCSGNDLKFLPKLPVKLRFLNCSGNDLSCLPTLPVELELLDCSVNQLTSLPELPIGLKFLECSCNNKLFALPRLNDKLKTLVCIQCNLYGLPPLQNLETLGCQNNDIRNLPELPNTLVYLTCSFNKLEYLPSLNECLFHLECDNNKLKELPPLPDTLELIDCEHNHLTEFPSLNDKLRILNCSNNKIRQLPAALNCNLEYLTCSNNELTHLPVLNRQLEHLNCSSNKITMLPMFPPLLVAIIFDKNPIYTELYNDEITCFDIQYYSMELIQNLHLNEDEYHDFIHEDQQRIDKMTVELSQKVRTLHDFRFLFYSLKYKSTFRNLLWDKIRRPKIEAKYHPDNLQKLLKNITEDNDVSEIWTAADN